MEEIVYLFLHEMVKESVLEILGIATILYMLQYLLSDEAYKESS